MIVVYPFINHELSVICEDLKKSLYRSAYDSALKKISQFYDRYGSKDNYQASRYLDIVINILLQNHSDIGDKPSGVMYNYELFIIELTKVNYLYFSSKNQNVLQLAYRVNQFISFVKNQKCLEYSTTKSFLCWGLSLFKGNIDQAVFQFANEMRHLSTPGRQLFHNIWIAIHNRNVSTPVFAKFFEGILRVYGKNDILFHNLFFEIYSCFDFSPEQARVISDALSAIEVFAHFAIPNIPQQIEQHEFFNYLVYSQVKNGYFEDNAYDQYNRGEWVNVLKNPSSSLSLKLVACTFAIEEGITIEEEILDQLYQSFCHPSRPTYLTRDEFRKHLFTNFRHICLIYYEISIFYAFLNHSLHNPEIYLPSLISKEPWILPDALVLLAHHYYSMGHVDAALTYASFAWDMNKFNIKAFSLTHSIDQNRARSMFEFLQRMAIRHPMYNTMVEKIEERFYTPSLTPSDYLNLDVDMELIYAEMEKGLLDAPILIE